MCVRARERMKKNSLDEQTRDNHGKEGGYIYAYGCRVRTASLKQGGGGVERDTWKRRSISNEVEEWEKEKLTEHKNLGRKMWFDDDEDDERKVRRERRDPITRLNTHTHDDDTHQYTHTHNTAIDSIPLTGTIMYTHTHNKIFFSSVLGHRWLSIPHILFNF